MLLYKAWLETRWRFVFMMVMTALFWLPRFMGAPTQKGWVGVAVGMMLLNCISPLYLAGSGVNSQTTYSAVSGFHGSMFFTLSLPVSRRRLFFARAGFGAMESCAFVLLTTAAIPLFKPDASLFQLLRYGARAIVCTLAIYALSTFLSCILDEMWQFTGAILILGGVAMLQFRVAGISFFSPLRGLNLLTCPLTALTPWAPMLTSVVCVAVLLFASVWVMERKEY